MRLDFFKKFFLVFFLVEKYNPKSIIIGYDSKFGYHGKGDYLFLKEYLSMD